MYDFAEFCNMVNITVVLMHFYSSIKLDLNCVSEFNFRKLN